jgi:uncharacterized protein YbgA (DUF1722 family)/uncharacterized protein YbbK (DUF523 family)
MRNLPVRDRLRVGASSCLLGNEVRFDGGHKRDDFLTEALQPFVTLVPVCPEVEVGMGTPREVVRLVERDGEIRLVAPKSQLDHTERMRSWAERRLDDLASEDLVGYVLKKDSPSCGMERVKVYGPGGMANKVGRGVFADRLLARFPDLPVEEEGRLHDPLLRENFIVRLFAFRRVKDLFAGRWSRGDVVRFHTAEKLLLLAHDTPAYERLGRLVARVKDTPRDELARSYRATYMAALGRPARRRQHVNVLQHMAGHFKKLLDRADRDELAGSIRDYRLGLVPLVVPITLFRHHVRRHGVTWLEGQVYLEPHPRELMLRNHA